MKIRIGKFGRLLLRRAPGGGAGGGGRPVRRALCDAGSHHPQPGHDGPSGPPWACGRWIRPEEVPEGSEVIIRSHGESRAVHEGLHARGVRILDATCPNVTRIHQIVARAEEQGRQPIIIGTPGPPGGAGHCGLVLPPGGPVWSGGAGKLAGGGPVPTPKCHSLLCPRPRPSAEFGIPA